MERLIGTLRRECTDHVLILGEATWRSFLPPRGAASIVHVWDGGCSKHPSEVVRRVTRANAKLADLEHSLGGDSCWVAGDNPIFCLTPVNGPQTTITFAPRAGKLFVSELRYETRDGCKLTTSRKVFYKWRAEAAWTVDVPGGLVLLGS